ncbi:MAG TPA: hypothetical protein PLD84_05725 [Chitinophagales bacterium]|nr:hypothetical protein [Chitinophagales bacterium]
MEKKKFHRIYLLLLFSVFFLHLPFLNADPDLHLSASRDAFTDEGLNTSQLRNFINRDSLDFWECDNLVKNPLFNAILFVPLKLFGTHLIIARITILIFIFCLMLLTTKNPYFRSITAIAAITTLLQYYVFQYSHFSLSEMLSTAFILSGIYYLYLFIENKFQKNFQLVFASVFLAASYYSKIQFIYIAPLIPAVILLLMAINKEFPTCPSLRHLIMSVGLMILLITVYTIFWYLPHREIFDYVLKEEASGKYAALSSMPKTIAFNITRVLFSSNTWIINSLFLSCFIAGCLFWKQ